MRAPRFSIRGLLVGVALVSVGLAAFVSASPVWASVLFTLSLFSLGVALIALCFGRATTRAFGGGYLILGGLYFLAVSAPFLSDHWRDQLVTSDLAQFAYQPRALNDALAEFDPEGARGLWARFEEAGTKLQVLDASGVEVWKSTPMHLPAASSIARSLGGVFTIAVGLLGGWIALCFAGQPAAHAGRRETL